MPTLTKKQQAQIARERKLRTEAKARQARIARMTRNILAIFSRATSEEIKQGLHWYQVARTLILTIAYRFGIEPRIAIAVFAVLSPNNSFTGNLRDTELVLRFFTNRPRKFANLVKRYDAAPGKYRPRGESYALAEIGAQTYPACVLKAYRILRDQSTHHLTETARKTFAFFDNLANDHSDLVTIDFHAYNIARKTQHSSKDLPTISKGAYAEISEAYTIAARRLGIEPRQLQAITWTVRRNELDKRDLAHAESNALAKVRNNRMARERSLYAAL